MVDNSQGSSSNSPSPAPIARSRDSGLCSTSEIPEIPSFCVDNLNSIRLGRGTYGVVEKTRYRKSRNHEFRPAAIKYANDSPSHLGVLIREAKVMMALNHDHVIRIYGLYPCPRNGRGVVMEYMDCGSMADLIYRRQNIDYKIDHVASWMWQLSSAVDFFHKNEQVHRDLKLQNMLLGNKYRTMKLCDFGTFTTLHQSMTSNRGTPITMAPEIFRCEQYNTKSDIYSVGIIFWQLMARDHPYNPNMSVPGLLYNVATGNLRPPELSCNPVFSNFFKKCWDNDQDVRPSSDKCVLYFKCMRDEFPGGNDLLKDTTTNDSAHTPQPRPLRASPNSTSGSKTPTPTPTNRLNPLQVPARTHRRTGSDQTTMINSLKPPSPSIHTAPANPVMKSARSKSVAADLAAVARQPHRDAPPPPRRRSSEESRAALLSLLDDEDLRPGEPNVLDPTSLEIYNEHCKLCEDLVQVNEFKKAVMIAKHRTLSDWRQHERHAALLERMHYLEEAIARIERNSVSTDDDGSVIMERL